jgi:hypothetical protein
MFALALQVDGANGPDIVAGGKGKNAALGWLEAPEAPRRLEDFRWHSISPVGWVMSIWDRDMDGDGDPDLVISDRKGTLRGCRWLENPGPGPKQKEPWLNHFMGGRESEVMFMSWADLDGDGREDAVAALKPLTILYLRRLDGSGLRWKEYSIDIDFNTGNVKAVTAGDLNRDGRLDLAVTTENAKGKHGVFWLEYTGEPSDRVWAFHPISGVERGIKYDRIELLDLDRDGDLDLLTCEEREGGKGLGVFWHENPWVRK